MSSKETKPTSTEDIPKNNTPPVAVVTSPSTATSTAASTPAVASGKSTPASTASSAKKSGKKKSAKKTKRANVGGSPFPSNKRARKSLFAKEDASPVKTNKNNVPNEFAKLIVVKPKEENGFPGIIVTVCDTKGGGFCEYGIAQCFFMRDKSANAREMINKYAAVPHVFNYHDPTTHEKVMKIKDPKTGREFEQRAFLFPIDGEQAEPLDNDQWLKDFYATLKEDVELCRFKKGRWCNLHPTEWKTVVDTWGSVLDCEVEGHASFFFKHLSSTKKGVAGTLQEDHSLLYSYYPEGKVPSEMFEKCGLNLNHLKDGDKATFEEWSQLMESNDSDDDNESTTSSSTGSEDEDEEGDTKPEHAEGETTEDDKKPEATETNDNGDSLVDTDEEQ